MKRISTVLLVAAMSCGMLHAQDNSKGYYKDLFVDGGISLTSRDKLPAAEVAAFRKTLADYKRQGASKEQIIKIYREEGSNWGASKEQIEIVVDLINDSWDSL